MHIPDGYLDIATAATTYAIFMIYGGYVLRKVKGKLTSENISLISVLAAGIFASQMLNWPIPGGTSLHFVGGGLVGIMLGPWLGFLVMTIVLLVQCLVFHDGGITALGANATNMAIIDVVVGYLIYRSLIKVFDVKRTGQTAAAFFAGWLGTVISGAACGLEIGYSHLFPYGFTITVPVMAGWHAVLGIIEGFITALVVIYLTNRAPHLIYSGRRD